MGENLSNFLSLHFLFNFDPNWKKNLWKINFCLLCPVNFRSTLYLSYEFFLFFQSYFEGGIGFWIIQLIFRKKSNHWNLSSYLSTYNEIYQASLETEFYREKLSSFKQANQSTKLWKIPKYFINVMGIDLLKNVAESLVEYWWRN